jgi:hypothetical protein
MQVIDMAKAKLRFTERDVSRAIRAASKAGIEVARVVVDTAGNIVVVAAPSPQIINDTQIVEAAE